MLNSMDPRRDVLTLLEQHGVLLRRNKHAIYQVNGRTLTVPISPSDKRTWLNLRSILRRILAQPSL